MKTLATLGNFVIPVAGERNVLAMSETWGQFNWDRARLPFWSSVPVQSSSRRKPPPSTSCEHPQHTDRTLELSSGTKIYLSIFILYMESIFQRVVRSKSLDCHKIR